MGDSQLNREWFSWLRVQPSIAIEQGWAWSHQLSAPVTPAADELVRMETGERSVVLFAIDVHTDGDRGVLITMFAGGRIDLSAPMPGFPLNEERPRASPWEDISDNGFLAVQGGQIASLLIDEAGRTRVTPQWILRPSQLYYMTIKNLHNQTVQIEVAIEAYSIGDMIR